MCISYYLHQTTFGFVIAEVVLITRLVIIIDLIPAKDTCKELLEKDPNRLDIVDMYSNILYVKEDKAALNYLAHHTVEVSVGKEMYD